MKWRAGLYNAVIGNNGYAGATGCAALSDFAQVSDHGFQAFQTGQRSPVETAGIVPDSIERADNVAPARLEIFSQVSPMR